MLNALKISDLSAVGRNAIVGEKPRRGQPDALRTPLFGLAANRSYCSSVRKSARKDEARKPASLISFGDGIRFR